MLSHRLKILFVSEKKKNSTYFSTAIKKIKKYFEQVDIEYLQLDNEKKIDEKWIIVIINDIPLNNIKRTFVENFNKNFTLFIYLAKEYTDTTIQEAYEKEFDYVMNMKLTSPSNFSLFLRNVITKRLEIKATNQKTKYGNILLDLVSRRVWIKGEECDLTKKEFDVLALLIRNKNHYIDQNFIFSEVWKTDDYDRTRSVSQYIFRLKKKIGYDYIKTNPQFGYKIVNQNK